jgi:hypothetical protein
VSTGFPGADAERAFARERRRQAIARIAARLRAQPDDVSSTLPFEPVVDALGRRGERDLGVMTIPVGAVVGTVDRRPDSFDRSFRPRSPALRQRWERIAAARRRGEPMPPIDVYRVGDIYFVRDGHHRVSVARTLGRRTIDAYVVEVVTRVGAERSLRVGDLPLKSHERLFHERVPLPARARERIRLSHPWDFGALAEGVEAWAFRAMQDRAEFVDRPTAARLWFDEEYVPVVDMLRAADMIGEGTEAEAYMRVVAHRYRMMRTHEWNEEILARLRDLAPRR